MKLSKSGYRKDSKDKGAKSLVIPSGNISMKNVEHPVFGVDNLGNSQMMFPGAEYGFAGDYVNEFPIKQMGGGIEPGYVNQAGSYKQLNQRDMQTLWEADPKRKNIPFTTKLESVQDGKGKPYYNYFFYKGDNKPTAMVNLPTAVQEKVKKSTILDPMKQSGFNGVLLDDEQMQMGGGIKKLLSNPMVQTLAPIAANIIAPGSGLFVGAGLKAFNAINANQQPQQQPLQQGQQPQQQPGEGNLLGSVMGAMNIAGSLGAFEKGGGLNKFMKNYYKDGWSPQGLSMDDFLTKHNSQFVDYIANTTQQVMLEKEVYAYNKYRKQMGGEPSWNQYDPTVYADGLVGSGEYQPQNSATPAAAPVIAPQHPMGSAPTQPSNFNTLGPFGAYTSNPTGPSFIPGANSPQQNMYVQTPSGNAGQTFGDQLNVNYADIAKEKGITANPGMSGDIMGMVGEFFNPETMMKRMNSKYEFREAKRKEDWLEKQQTIENVAPTSYGSRGDYDTNSGAFRPDQMTPGQYQKGGEKSLKDLVISKGLTEKDFEKFRPEIERIYADIKKPGKYDPGFMDSLKIKMAKQAFPNVPSLIEEVDKTTYKKGGEYDLDHKTIMDLVSQGYEIEFVK